MTRISVWDDILVDGHKAIVDNLIKEARKSGLCPVTVDIRGEWTKPQELANCRLDNAPVFKITTETGTFFVPESKVDKVEDRLLRVRTRTIYGFTRSGLVFFTYTSSISSDPWNATESFEHIHMGPNTKIVNRGYHMGLDGYSVPYRIYAITDEELEKIKASHPESEK